MNLLSPSGDHVVELKEILRSYSKHWKWFLFSLILAIAGAFLYLRYATPQFIARAKIQIMDEKNSSSTLDLFQDLNYLNGGVNQVQDEIELINSRSNFVEVVQELGLNIKMMSQGNLVDREIYSRHPVKLNFIVPDSVMYNADFTFYLSIATSTTFGYSEEEDSPLKVHAFGKTITTPVGDLVVTPDIENIKRFKDDRIKVTIKPLHTVAQNYKNKIMLGQTDDYSNIVNISLEDPIRKKARDIINSLIRIYNRNAIEDKKTIADRTSNFIDDRIADISQSLSSVDQSAEDLKTSRGLTDIQSEANINLNVGAANRQELANFRTQLEIAASMQDIVEQQPGYEVLPGNIGLNDPTIANTTEKYNQLVMERQRLLKSSTERSPIIQNLDQQLTGLKRSMMSSLNSTVNNLGMQVNTLSGQQAIINSKIYSAPRNERALRDITRQQQTTESLYLYLLQKREEAQIAVASTAPKSKIIDYAYNPTDMPVTPKRKLVYLASLLLGLFVPFSIIYTKDLLDNKVHNMHTLEKISLDIPVLGELPKISKNGEKIVLREDRSVLAEALRIVRTNLDYLIKSKRKAGKNNVIFVTSSVPGEGKTFLSTNLSMILASTNKKVVLVGADIRNPKLYTFFMGSQIDKLSKVARNKDAGLTEFLYDDQLMARDIINPMLVHTHTIDVIYSGRIPPNPAELLMSDRLKGLLREMSELYDYVIVDTAPLMVVSDTLLIAEHADHMVYVTRAGVTDKKAIEFPIKLQEEGKINNLSFVVNDVKSSNLGYGGKYGYGYTSSKGKWWQV